MLTTGNGSPALISPLRDLDPVELSRSAAKESRNRETRVPSVSVFRWWARRTEAIMGPIIEAFASGFDRPIAIADFFSGGGTVPIAALRRGHSVYAQDINSWATLGLQETLRLPKADRIQELARELESGTMSCLAPLYETVLSDGSAGQVAHTLRVTKSTCTACGKEHRNFPHCLISLCTRKERGELGAYLACPVGHLWLGQATGIQECPICGARCDPKIRYMDGRQVTCISCGKTESLRARFSRSVPRWETVLVERTTHSVRELCFPTDAEMIQADLTPEFNSVLAGLTIPEGPETHRLKQMGYDYWSDIYPDRQEYALNLLITAIDSLAANDHERSLLRMIACGAAEMAGYLSRWDRYYLKPYEVMAGHRFSTPVLAVEPNVWGAPRSGRGTFNRRVRQVKRASTWLHDELEMLPVTVSISDSDSGKQSTLDDVDIHVVAGDSSNTLLSDKCIDLILTDPPYHDDVHYSNLASLFHAWRQTSSPETPLETLALSDTSEYGDGLYEIFAEMRRVLSDDGHLVLTYANRSPTAWVQLFTALQRAGFWPVDYAVVHAENEVDGFKRGRRSCVLDLVMNLVKCRPKQRSSTRDDVAPFDTDESDALYFVASHFMQIGHLDSQWPSAFIEDFQRLTFLETSAIGYVD